MLGERKAWHGATAADELAPFIRAVGARMGVGGKASADFDYSGPLTELALLGNVAKRFPDRKLLWDNDNMKVTNLDEANEWVRRTYRKGWSL